MLATKQFFKITFYLNNSTLHFIEKMVSMPKNYFKNVVVWIDMIHSFRPTLRTPSGMLVSIDRRLL